MGNRQSEQWQRENKRENRTNKQISLYLNEFLLAVELMSKDLDSPEWHCLFHCIEISQNKDPLEKYKMINHSIKKTNKTKQY